MASILPHSLVTDIVPSESPIIVLVVTLYYDLDSLNHTSIIDLLSELLKSAS
jgi:hypothetical protein